MLARGADVLCFNEGKRAPLLRHPSFATATVAQVMLRACSLASPRGYFCSSWLHCIVKPTFERLTARFFGSMEKSRRYLRFRIGLGLKCINYDPFWGTGGTRPALFRSFGPPHHFRVTRE